MAIAERLYPWAFVLLVACAGSSRPCPESPPRDAGRGGGQASIGSPDTVRCPCACEGTAVEALPPPALALASLHGRDVPSLFAPWVRQALRHAGLEEAKVASALFPPAGDPGARQTTLHELYPELEPLPRVPVGSVAQTSADFSYVTGAELRVHQWLGLAGSPPRALVLYSEFDPQETVIGRLTTEWHVALISLSPVAVVARASFLTRIPHRAPDAWKALATELALSRGGVTARVRYLREAPRRRGQGDPFAGQNTQEFTAKIRVGDGCLAVESVELTRDDYVSPS